MRSYPANSPQAGRLLALTIISDGKIAPLRGAVSEFGGVGCETEHRPATRTTIPVLLRFAIASRRPFAGVHKFYVF
jgi:hypothetical protein